MRDNKHATSFLREWHYAEQTLRRISFAKQVIQASTASSHRVGKCIFEPSKQLRIRRSSFWSHRRSTVRWETALSSKERSRRVNCPMLVPYWKTGYYAPIIKSKFTLSNNTLNNKLNTLNLILFVLRNTQILSLFTCYFIGEKVFLFHWGSDKL